jgi:hypothetical protein
MVELAGNVDSAGVAVGGERLTHVAEPAAGVVVEGVDADGSVGFVVVGGAVVRTAGWAKLPLQCEMESGFDVGDEEQMRGWSGGQQHAEEVRVVMAEGEELAVVGKP